MFPSYSKSTARNISSRYDALTTSNRIAYQNTLNSSNFQFAAACGSILTNYCWKEVDAEKSLQLALGRELLPRNIFFGIDVWAQNKSSLTHPRVTYPEYGGGGTNTGVAIDELSKLGLSAGIFAPAWSFEHFPGNERAVERTVWEGASITKHIECTCGDCESRHGPNKDFAIIKSAAEWCAGSEHFFYTDFSRAFGMHANEEKDIFEGYSRHAQLGTQSLLPRPIMQNFDGQAIELSYRPSSTAKFPCLAIDATQKHPVKDGTQECSLPLYILDLSFTFWNSGKVTHMYRMEFDYDLSTNFKPALTWKAFLCPSSRGLVPLLTYLTA